MAPVFLHSLLSAQVAGELTLETLCGGNRQRLQFEIFLQEAIMAEALLHPTEEVIYVTITVTELLETILKNLSAQTQQLRREILNLLEDDQIRGLIIQDIMSSTALNIISVMANFIGVNDSEGETMALTIIVERKLEA
jgi:hypothetical protein